MQNIINDGKEITVNCHFCNKDYTYSIKELEFLLENAKLKSAARKLGLTKEKEEEAVN